jgi:hypothetical protein
VIISLASVVYYSQATRLGCTLARYRFSLETAQVLAEDESIPHAMMASNVKYNRKEERVILGHNPDMSISIVELLQVEGYIDRKKAARFLPKQILGEDENWNVVFRSIKDYIECLSRSQQQAETNRWKELPRWKRQLHQSRIDALQKQRAQLLAKKHSAQRIMVASTPRRSSNAQAGMITPAMTSRSTDKLGMNLFSAVVHIVRGIRVGG